MQHDKQSYRATSALWFKDILFRRNGLGTAYKVAMPSPEQVLYATNRQNITLDLPSVCLPAGEFAAACCSCAAVWTLNALGNDAVGNKKKTHVKTQNKA